MEIAPVTVVLGKNNSGKSALVRAPLVLATGFDTDSTAPLDLERLGPDAPDSFTDLIYNQSPHGKIKFEVEVTGERPFSLDATLQYVDEVSTALIADFRLRSDRTEVEWHWWPPSSPGEADLIYTDRNGDNATNVDFAGLLPRDTAAALSLGPIRYLSSHRDRGERHHRLPFGQRLEIGTRAEHVAAVLAHDRARAAGKLIDTVNGYLRHIVEGWQIDEIDAGPLWTTVLTRPGTRLKVNLADAGTGLSQVLPILVQCALDEHYSEPGQAPLQIIEEPEMHLHPAAHAELADLYLRTAQATGTRFLVETHSETLLLRLRRRIAEDAYPPEMIAVYMVEQADGASTVRRVDIDAIGRLGEEWPEGYFSTDYHDARLLAAAQLRRATNVA